MKHAIIGTALLLYSLLLSPAFLEPSDLIVSTAWIAAATAANIPIFVITLWIISGYIAFIIGISLLGHSIFRRLPTVATAVKNPGVLILFVAITVLAICLWTGTI